MVAGRTGQEYNIRKNRKGAFWEDRYHATAVENYRYLRQGITYIDMNMVRAGVVEHPRRWEFCGYNEIQNPRKRKGIIEEMKKALEYRAKGRKIISADDSFELREAEAPFGNADNLDCGNTYLWNQQPPPFIGQFLHEN